MRAHLLVQTSPEIRLSGLVDFEPAMVGAPDYELASVGVFVTEGDPELFRRVMARLDPDALSDPKRLARRCLAYTLLHRYANIPWFMERVPPEPGVDTLEGLAQRWFGV